MIYIYIYICVCVCVSKCENLFWRTILRLNDATEGMLLVLDSTKNTEYSHSQSVAARFKTNNTTVFKLFEFETRVPGTSSIVFECDSVKCDGVGFLVYIYIFIYIYQYGR